MAHLLHYPYKLDRYVSWYWFDWPCLPPVLFVWRRTMRFCEDLLDGSTLTSTEHVKPFTVVSLYMVKQHTAEAARGYVTDGADISPDVQMWSIRLAFPLTTKYGSERKPSGWRWEKMERDGFWPTFCYFTHRWNIWSQYSLWFPKV